MHQARSARARWSLLSVIVALAASVALSADAARATAPDLGATPPHARAAVEALTGRIATGLESAAPNLGAATVLGDPAAAFDLRGTTLPDAPVISAPIVTTTPTVTTSTDSSAPKQVWWKRYAGTNHVWMPTLGINKAIYFYPCSRTRDPGNVVYRWGCAGTNNVYLLGHARGVFKALRDAYFNGKLQVGMPVVYANGNGKTSLYRVVSWRVVDPYQVDWAVADQRVPSMTLQTCIGKDDSMRLLVRLVQADR